MADCAGFLTKEGGRFKTWKKRWFVLKNNDMFYSKKQNAGELGTIHLAGLTIDHVGICSTKKRAFCFQVQTPSRIYYLVSESEKDRDKWIEAIKQSIMSQSQQKGGSNGTSKAVGLQDFDLLNVIGKGSFGKVIQVRKKDTGRIYAMKVLNKKNILENNELEHTRTEKNILQKLVHPFLINLNYCFQTPDKLYFVMDYINGGELFYHLQKEHKFSPDRVRFYCAEIALGLEYLHNSGVIYRDLKPENILLTDEGHIILTDFGISKEGLIAEDSKTQTFCGTPEYLAPEVLEGRGYTKAVDWWSFGTLMFEMLTGLPPYYSQDVQQMYFKIMNAKLEFPDNLDESTQSILRGLLERDPNKRLSDAQAIKQHPYFKSIDWDKILKKEIVPPYIPPVRDRSDVSMVDPVFTAERPTISEGSDPVGVIDKDSQSKFEGFTFVPEN